MTIAELPEGCIAIVISLTTPADACRLSCVNSLFKSAADSDAVWDRFLPADYRSLISNSDSSTTSDPAWTHFGSLFSDSHSSSSSTPAPPLWLSFRTKKELYLSLCQNPILIDEGKMSFQLDKQSGKKCYMISARNLTIVWGDTPPYWRWTSSVQGSRFPEVAELNRVCWLEIRGKITTCILSPSTNYAAYLVFKSVAVAYYGFVNQPVEVSFGYVGSDIHKRAVYLDPEGGGQNPPQFQSSRVVRAVYLDPEGGAQNPPQVHIPRIVRLPHRRRFVRPVGSAPRENDGHCAKERRDGWLEVELGEIFVREGEKKELEMSIMEVTGGNWKQGLIIQGIEIRPKYINK